MEKLKLFYKKYLKYYISTTLIYYFLISCTPVGVERSLENSGKNREELEKVIEHYSGNIFKRKKLCAVYYLIENMRWHKRFYRPVIYDTSIIYYINYTDSIYYSMAKDKVNDSINTKEFRTIMQNQQKLSRAIIENNKFKEVEYSNILIPDLEYVNSTFLINHIDFAFNTWENSKYAKHLNFKEFCEYLLPYRSADYAKYLSNSSNLKKLFFKYAEINRNDSIQAYVQRFNWAIDRLSYFNGKYPYKNSIGFNSMLFRNGAPDCTDIAVYGADALKAIGVPTVVNFCIGYKVFPDRHYFCSTLDSSKRCLPFNPCSDVPVYNNKNFVGCLNIYRFFYKIQKDAPIFLAAKGEYVPDLLKNPYIKDVTREIIKDVVEVSLPFTKNTNNNLAYLFAFQPKSGLTPVTYGKINKRIQKAVFKNVVLDNLYFIGYYNNGYPTITDDPFFVNKDSTNKLGFSVIPLYSGKYTNKKKVKAYITRKYPVKFKTLDLINKLKGVCILGSNDTTFINADTLYKVSSTLPPYCSDIVLNNNKAYKYYKVANTDEYPHLHISEIQLLAKNSFGYKNTSKPMHINIMKAEDSVFVNTNYVKLNSIPSKDYSWRSVNDSNVQSAPDNFKEIIFKFNSAKVVNIMRVVPKNANNGIVPGNEYELFYWNGAKWASIGIRKARFNYLDYGNLQTGVMYWLRNLTEGSEELPFFIDDNGEQNFIHLDILRQIEDIQMRS